MSSNNQQQPSMIASHAKYAKGAAVEGVGSVAGWEDWKQSGSTEKQQATDELKAVGDMRDPHRDGYGKMEEAAGVLTGCPGMKEEGAASKKN